ncbi:ABC transporter permease [Cryptosporangium sp. NPDC051539]|uniref:ABC transporter permease n=1 Tax=Cryptosporangium sp. NPDC051539 TaxID=3363962 RepID=UPI0037A2D356
MRRVLRPLQWVWLLAVVLLVWELLTRTVAQSLFVPPVSDILRTFGTTWFAGSPGTLFLSEEFRTNVLPSIGRIAAGYTIASVVGICGGILLGVWRPAGAFFNPLIRLGMSVPVTALLPLAIVVFGITNSMNVFLIALGCLWPILINAYDGARGIDGTMTLTARSMQLSRRRYFLSVLLPGASPAIVAGMRVSVGTAMVLMVVSELYAATSGLGYYLTQQQRLFRFPQLWSAILLIALIGILANAAFAALERSALRWHHVARGESQ